MNIMNIYSKYLYVKMYKFSFLITLIIMFIRCISYYWAYEIKNSLEVAYSNGPIEKIGLFMELKITCF